MIICGLKLTHDGAVALLDGDRLVFSVEIEKLANNRRYSDMPDLRVIPEILASFGCRVADVDEWVIDGWDGDVSRDLELADHGRAITLTVGPYRESASSPSLTSPSLTGQFTIDGKELVYTSYPHAAGHLAGTYCSSPFADRGEPSFVLIWDGGLFPRLYWVDPDRGVDNGGELFPLIGHAYAMAGLSFGPFRGLPQKTKTDELSVAGKLMAYIALGKADTPVIDVLRETFHETFESKTPEAVRYRETIGGFGSLFEPSRAPVNAFLGKVRDRVEALGVPDEDVLASFHQFLEELLVERIEAKVREWKGDGPWNLCFAGGCALNINWNSALRARSLFGEMWVPPFPNDSGSALGVATLGMIQHRGIGPITWHPQSGSALGPVTEVPCGWTSRRAAAAEVARLLHESGEPVVVLEGRAELGPRALGGRSIIAPAADPAMKDRLNDIKNRESYRPVAPICLVEEAPKIFDPGTPDPYMLFDHDVREGWASRIPAVIHLDGTARLQTVSSDDFPEIAALLAEYHKLSGIPVLCNTSANFNGSGFFPDVASAIEWGRVARVWSEGVLYERTGS
ncbi:carbamoyltransferase N-terminal domain-containing protein [Amycolatopsis aidingensis]|uniref:carbamoyltransferase N-terminal domain-containing protein n=1 Tax=Amycolatopsis aidingensis TaxID=2842453 RepID=UPI001C0BA5CC|nr:carbamoyltransferase N-terminal domain-containing protein [Amycolatopsis aidingensis]